MSELKKIFEKVSFFRSFLQMGVRRQLWNFSHNKIRTIKVHDNEKFKFKCFGDVTRLLYSRESFIKNRQSFEYVPILEFKRLLKPGCVMLDIGANVGLYSLLGSRLLGDSGKIYAFEPGKETFDVLNTNLKLNGCSNVKTFNVGLSNESGNASLTQPKEIANTGIKGDSLNFLNFDSSDADEEKITLLTLDEVIKSENIEHVDFIKIDIEGAEMLCFQGAEKLFQRASKPIIFMECADSLSHRFGYSTFQILSYLSKFGYEFYQFDFNMWVAKART